MAALDGLLFVLVVVLVGGSLLLRFWLRARNRKAMRAWAQAHGHRFEERGPELVDRFERLEPFGRGHTRRAYHVVHGTHEGSPFRVFQYEFTTGSGKNRQRHVHHVCALELSRSAPGLVVRREHVGHKLFDALGGEDIDFESDEFSRRFWVRCRDRRFAYDVLHPRMMEHLMPLDGFLWQWDGADLLLSRSGRISPQRAEAMLSAAAGFVALLPRHRLPAPGHPSPS